MLLSEALSSGVHAVRADRSHDISHDDQILLVTCYIKKNLELKERVH